MSHLTPICLGSILANDAPTTSSRGISAAAPGPRHRPPLALNGSRREEKSPAAAVTHHMLGPVLICLQQSSCMTAVKMSIKNWNNLKNMEIR
uniref:Uncharacterized protein n=1 Tax=Oryza nivara TaxID=4536 RepID=A0A0E0J285_ORYNI